MARRNPMNERYTSDEKTGGATRGGATSMKPASKAGASVRVESKKKSTGNSRSRAASMLMGNNSKSKEEKKAERQKRRQEEDTLFTASSILVEKDPAYTKWRRVWWGCLISAVVFTALSWGTLSMSLNDVVSIVILVLAYGTIIAALVIDLGPVRKRRNVARGKVDAMTKNQVDRLITDSYTEREAKSVATKARKAAKKNGQDPQAAYQKAYDETIAAIKAGTYKSEAAQARARAEEKKAAKAAEAAQAAKEKGPGIHLGKRTKEAAQQAREAKAAVQKIQADAAQNAQKAQAAGGASAAKPDAAGTSKPAEPEEPLTPEEVARREKAAKIAREFNESRRSKS